MEGARPPVEPRGGAEVYPVAGKAILEGSVTSTGQGFRVHVELVAAQTNFQMWSGTFITNGTDVFAIGAGTAEEIAAKLKEAGK